MKTRISALLIAGFLFHFAASPEAGADAWLVADHGIVGNTYTLLEVQKVPAGKTEPEGPKTLLVCGNNYDGVFAIDPVTGKMSFEFKTATTGDLDFDTAFGACESSANRAEAARSSANSVENFRAMSDQQQVDSCRAILELSTDSTFQASGLADFCGVLVVATLADQGIDNPMTMHEGADPKYCYEVGLMYRGIAWEWSRIARDVGKKGFNKAMKTLYAHEKKEFLKRAQIHLLNAGDSHCLSTRTASGGGSGSGGDDDDDSSPSGGIAL